jgi:hypothetical protein
MEIMTGIQIALMSGRTPIVAPFFGYDAHLGGAAGVIPTSDVFDLSRLSMYWEKPMVEAHELKANIGLRNHSRVLKYDGEFPEMGLEMGDLIHAELPEEDPIGVWSTHLLWSKGSAPRGVFKPNSESTTRA